MAKKIKVSEIGDYGEEKFDKLIRACVLEGWGKLISKSPVDTGRFRASWRVGQNEAAFPGEKAGGSYGAPSQEPKKTNYTLEKTGNTYNIYNNLRYALKLEQGNAGSGSKDVNRYDPKRKVKTWGSPGGGSSIQTGGPGWIKLAAKGLQNRIPMIAKQIDREG